MTLSFLAVIFILVLFIIAVSIIMLVKYMDKREKGNLHLHIKLGSFEFVVDTSAEKVVKRVNKD